MNAEFQWWLLIVGMVIGGALVYLVLADLQGDPDDADAPLGDEPDAQEPGGLSSDEPPDWSARGYQPHVEGDRPKAHSAEGDLD